MGTTALLLTECAALGLVDHLSLFYLSVSPRLSPCLPVPLSPCLLPRRVSVETWEACPCE
jgi:hypothetical protein